MLELLLFAAIVAADAAGLIPLTQTIFLLPLVWLSLRVRRCSWSSIGWSRPGQWPRTLLLGVVAGVALELLAVWVTTPLISDYFGVLPDYSGFRAIEGNASQLVLFLALSWTLAAFGEEICFRGYLLQRLAAMLGGSRIAWLVGLLASSALFGWGHTEQGVSGWVQEFLSGLLLGVLFLLAGKNLVLPIVAHGTSNTLAFVLIYLGRYPGAG